MFQTSSVVAYVSRFVAAGLLLGGAIACSKPDPTETAAYLDSLPRMTDGLAFYLPPGQQSRQTKDRLFLWARDAATGKSLFFEGEARYMGAPNEKWEGSTRFFSSQAQEATLRAASTATVYPASAEIVTELSNASERDVFVSSIHDGEYVERPHCLQCGCARPALRKTAELLCPGQHAGELCGGLKAIAYALDSDQVATVKFHNSDYCRWVLSENGDVILQRQSSSQPSSNISEEIPGLIVESHQEQFLQPKSCNPEEPVGVLPEKRLYRFDGTLLWWRRTASRDPIAEVSEGTACYPDVRVVFSGLKPELLDEPPTRPVYWQDR